MAIYGAGEDGKNPVRDKAKQFEVLWKAIDATSAFCATGPKCRQLRPAPLVVSQMDQECFRIHSPFTWEAETLTH